MKPKAPCLNCSDRRLGCHSKCDKYIWFRERLDILNKQESEARLLESDIKRLKKFKV